MFSARPQSAALASQKNGRPYMHLESWPCFQAPFKTFSNSFREKYPLKPKLASPVSFFWGNGGSNQAGAHVTTIHSRQRRRLAFRMCRGPAKMGAQGRGPTTTTPWRKKVRPSHREAFFHAREGVTCTAPMAKNISRSKSEKRLRSVW